MQTTFRRYLAGKAAWSGGALALAVVLNWCLPRLIPGSPVDLIVTRFGGGGLTQAQFQRIHDYYTHTFGLDLPLWQQFLVYLGNLAHGNLGVDLVLYPTPVGSLIRDAIPWTVALMVPAILVGWIVGNALGALAAYRGGWFDRGAFLGSLFISSMPYYCLAIILLYVGAVALRVLPAGGGLSYGSSPELSFDFLGDALQHYWMPFGSLVLVFIGSQAVGMRSMAIYEVGSDYVTYARSLGVGSRTLLRYIFRNASLPQVSGLAISISTLVSGALLTEIVFNYPGVGTLLFNAIRENDYPLISGLTLIIAIAVVLANFLVDIAYGLIDPRVRAAQAGEG